MSDEWDGKALYQMYNSFRNEFLHGGKWCHSYGYRSRTGLKSKYFKNRKGFLDRKAINHPRKESIQLFLSWYLNRGHNPSASLDDILEHNPAPYWLRRAQMIQNFREDVDFIHDSDLFEGDSLAVTDDGSTSMIMEMLNNKLVQYETLIILNFLSKGRLLEKMKSVDHYDKVVQVYEIRIDHYTRYWLRPTKSQLDQINQTMKHKEIEIGEIWL